MSHTERITHSLQQSDSPVKLVGSPNEITLNRGKFVRETTLQIVPTNASTEFSSIAKLLIGEDNPVNVKPREDTIFEVTTFDKAERGFEVTRLLFGQNESVFHKK